MRKPKFFFSWFREDIFCVFEVNGALFEAEEPYGDSDLYWIGPEGVGVEGKELEWLPEIDTVVEAFERA